ncbi:hypothetical protein N431DRAFT_135343 [Stipitochalara longipes BDJ]|nr:hypothetical protein N431DRAFT_135343 [Stipitochalara longipes BDJ]
MRSFAPQSAALARIAQLPRPVPFRPKPPFFCHSISLTPCRYQSNLPTSSSNNGHREDWAKVIEEYKKDKQRLARDLGADITKPARLRLARSYTQYGAFSEEIDYSQNWVKVIGEYKKDTKQLTRDLGGIAGSVDMKRSIFPQNTWTNAITSIIGDVLWYIVIVAATSLYYMTTGKERKFAKSEDTKDKEPAEDNGEGVETWFSDSEVEGKWQGQDD